MQQFVKKAFTTASKKLHQVPEHFWNKIFFLEGDPNLCIYFMLHFPAALPEWPVGFQHLQSHTVYMDFSATSPSYRRPLKAAGTSTFLKKTASLGTS